MLKRETLAKLGYNNKQMVPSGNQNAGSQSMKALPGLDNQSQLSLSSSKMTLEPLGGNTHKPKAIDYLKNNKESKESVREFIGFSRQILMS